MQVDSITIESSRRLFLTYDDLWSHNSNCMDVGKHALNDSTKETQSQYASDSRLCFHRVISGLPNSILTMTKPEDDDRMIMMTKKRIFKNLIMMSFSLFLFFVAFQSLQNLQSTMNAEGGRGMQSQALVYAVSMVSLLVLPDLLVKSFGAQRILVFTILLGIPFLASNYNPKYEFLMPSAVFMGVAIGPLSATYGLYTNEMSCRYFQSGVSESLESVLSKFNGLVSVFLESTQIVGNLISYWVLRPESVPITNLTNVTCGIDFFEHANYNPNLVPPSNEKREVLVSIFLTSAILAAILMSFFVDQLRNDIETTRRQERCRFLLKRLFATVAHACLPNQMLLIPLNIFMGMELAFYAGDFTKAYIACSWGLHHIGFVTVCLGVCGALMALLVGPLVKRTSLMTVLVLGACLSVGCITSLFFWSPTPDSVYEYFLFAGVWGMADAIWWSQLAALYGLMFPNDREAAFSNLYFWSFLGFTLSFSYANSFRVAVKINILLCFLVVGMVGYFISQIRIRCFTRREYILISSDEE